MTLLTRIRVDLSDFLEDIYKYQWISLSKNIFKTIQNLIDHFVQKYGLPKEIVFYLNEIPFTLPPYELIDIIQNGDLIIIKSNNSCCTKQIFKPLEKRPSIPSISNDPKIVKTLSKKESSSESSSSDRSSDSSEENNVPTINNEKKSIPNKKNVVTSSSSEVDSSDESDVDLKSRPKDLKNNHSHSVSVKSEDPVTINVNEASSSDDSSSSDDKIIKKKKMDHHDIQEKANISSVTKTVDIQITNFPTYTAKLNKKKRKRVRKNRNRNALSNSEKSLIVFSENNLSASTPQTNLSKVSGSLGKNGPNVSCESAMLVEHEDEEAVSKLGLSQLVNGGYTVVGRRKNGINSDPPINNNDENVEDLQSLTVPPKTGDIIAFKVLELSDSYNPTISNYKKGKVIHFDGDQIILDIEKGKNHNGSKLGKFDLCEEAVDFQEDKPSKYLWKELIDVKAYSIK
nr:coilin-like [Lepeophtheirus salmonis]